MILSNKGTRSAWRSFKNDGPLAQMARALALHAGGRGFESPTVHKGVKAHKDVQSLDGERLGFESQIFHNKKESNPKRR